MTTSDLHEVRQGVLVSSGERDLLPSYSMSVYRT
jgi:hypothetical protein